MQIFVNFLYGICGVKGVLYDDVCASLITAYGRHHLMLAKNFFEKRFSPLTVLYGDTDSIFVKYERRFSLQDMADVYNNEYLKHVLHIDTMELSPEANFKCIIFIRKKLYMAKTQDGKYKLSGFPKRLSPHVYQIMIDALHKILDEIAHKNNDESHLRIQELYQNLFNAYVRDEGDGSAAVYNIKVKPLAAYKSTTCRNCY